MRRRLVALLPLLLLAACRARKEPSLAGAGGQDGRVLWAVDVKAPAFPTLGPAVGADGTVYVQGRQPATLTSDGRAAIAGVHQQAVLHAVDATGHITRSQPGTNIDYLSHFELWIRMAPWGAAYAVDNEGGLYGMFTDGTQFYRKVKRHLKGPPAIADNGRLFVGESRGVVGFDLQSEDDPGTVAYQDTSYALAPVLLPDGGMYVPAIRYLHALAPNGEVRWSVPASFAPTVVGPQGTVYCTNKNRLLALDPGGSQLWEYHADDDLGPPAAGPDGSVVAIGAQGLVHFVGPDGQRRWAFPMDTPVWSLPVVGSDGSVYVTDRQGHVIALTPAGKRRWSVKMPRACGTPAVGDSGNAYVECADGKLYALAPP